MFRRSAQQIVGSKQGTRLSALSTISLGRTSGYMSKQNYFTQNSKTIFRTMDRNYCTTKYDGSSENIMKNSSACNSNIKPVRGGINLVQDMVTSVVGFIFGTISGISYMEWKSREMSKNSNIDTGTIVSVFRDLTGKILAKNPHLTMEETKSELLSCTLIW